MIHFMKSYKTALLIGTGLMALISSGAQAQLYKSDKVTIKGNLKNQFLYEENRSLSDGESTTSFSVEARVQAEIKATEDTTFFLDARGVKVGGDLFEDSVTGETIQAEEFLQLRQAYVHHDLNDHVPNTSVAVGRQRVREDYGIWWNNDQDLARVSYDTTQFEGFVGVGQNLFSYNSAENEFQGDDQDRFRAFAEGKWLTPYKNSVEARVLYENDHSGTPDIGDVISDDDTDDSDAELVWVGARLTNQDKPIIINKTNAFSYRADLIGVVGTMDDVTTTAGPGDNRTVTATNDVDVAAWAFDAQANYQMKNLPLKPVFTVGYAYGSGDDDDGADGDSNSFVQSDLESNTSYDVGSRALIHNYGEALRPELSNLHILKAGATINVTPSTNITTIVRKYYLADENSQIRSSRAQADVNGQDNDLGQAIDFAVNSNLTEEFDLDLPVVSGLNFRSTLGFFQSGDAFADTNDDETIVRGLAEVQVRF